MALFLVQVSTFRILKLETDIMGKAQHVINISFTKGNQYRILEYYINIVVRMRHMKKYKSYYIINNNKKEILYL